MGRKPIYRRAMTDAERQRRRRQRLRKERKLAKDAVKRQRRDAREVAVALCHDAVRAKPPEITPERIREWWTEARPPRRQHWPELDERTIGIIVIACSRERREQQNTDMAALRNHAQAVLKPTNALLSKLPAFIQALGTSQPQERDEDLRRLIIAQAAIEQLQAFLGPAAQAEHKPHVLFACKIAGTIKFAVEQLGIRVSLTSAQPDRPLTRFVAKVVDAVFGDVTTPDGIAQAVKREFADLRAPEKLTKATGTPARLG